MSSRLILDDGTGRERIVCIGEAPATAEVVQGKPFVGPSGMLLARWQRDVGIQRRDCYWTNLYPHQAPHNKIEQVAPRGSLLRTLEPWRDSLHERLAQLADPYVIVPMGNYALWAVTGKFGITKHRGSIYAYQDRRGRIIKVIPSIHPAAIFKQPGWERRCLADWRRIAADTTFRDLQTPVREHFIRPTWDECLAYEDDATRRAEVMALDIETPREMLNLQRTTKAGKTKTFRGKGDPRITCVGFAFEDNFSFTIPTLDWYWEHQGVQLSDVWDLIRRLCALPCEKVMQNGFFDSWWLRQPEYVCPIRNYRWDTRWMHHCLDPLDDHNLAYQASTATREPYWKDDHKGTDDPENDPTDIDTFWRYNGKDCCVTRELIETHARKLEATGRLKFYDRHYRQMFEPIIRMMLVGRRVEDRKRVFRHARLLADCIAIQERLTKIAGHELHGPKGDFSSVKLAKFLYEGLRLPRQTIKGKVTANEVAVRKLVLRVPEFRETGGMILDHRRKYKLASFIKEGIADPDGRVRSSFGWVDTLRFSSGKNPRRTGANSQNTDREVLDLYLPDEGRIFLEVDESQGEDRIVKCLAAASTRDPQRQAHLLERARSKPWEHDEHRRAASIIYNVPEVDVTREPNGGQRYIGKRCRHAGNYDMHGRRLADELLKEGLVYTPEECEGYIQRLIDKDIPEIRLWQREVRQTVLRDRCMATTWGYVVDYTYERLSDDLYRSAYALIPQHELAMILNEWGFKPLHYWLSTQGWPAEINNQKHDSLLISTPPEWAWPIACFLEESLERSRTYAGFELTIPVEFKLGRTEKGDVEFKKFPTQDEFESAAFTLAKGDSFVA